MSWKHVTALVVLLGLLLGPVIPIHGAAKKGPMPEPQGQLSSRFVVPCGDDDPFIVLVRGYTMTGHEERPIFDYFQAYLRPIYEDVDERPFWLVSTDSYNLFQTEWLDIDVDGRLDAAGVLDFPLYDEDGEVLILEGSDQPMIGDHLCDVARIVMKTRDRLNYLRWLALPEAQ